MLKPMEIQKVYMHRIRYFNFLIKGQHHFPETYFIESSFFRNAISSNVNWSNRHVAELYNCRNYIMSTVILSNLYLAERHLPYTSFSLHII